MSTYNSPPSANTERPAPQGPSNAIYLEQDFVNDIQQRFQRLRGLIRTTVGYENDAFGLTTKEESSIPSELRGNADPREAFDFNTNTGLTDAFIQWLTQALRDELLEPLPTSRIERGEHWTAAYIRGAFVAGANQATGLLFQQGRGVENPSDETFFQSPFYAKTLKNLYQRTYQNLKDISEATAPVVRETVTRGFVEGWNPKKMARELTAEVRDIQHTRAETLARTEVQHAHTEGALRRYEDAGVSVVGHIDHLTAMDEDVCPFCRRLGDESFTIDEYRETTALFRGQTYRVAAPSHPNCRCTPVVAGDSGTLAPLSERVPGRIISRA